MDKFFRIRHTVASACILVCTFSLPDSSQAQIDQQSFQVYSICMAQNWDMPRNQLILAQQELRQRAEIFSMISFSEPVKRCLMTKKLVPIGLCEGMFDRMKANIERDGSAAVPTTEESKTILGAIAAGACDAQSNAEHIEDWVPPGLEPDADTVALMERAKQADVAAQIALAWIYLRGQKAPVNPQRAEFWMKQAAAAGNLEAHYILGEWYADSQPTGNKMPEAIRLLSLAADQGHALAMQRLAQILLRKRGDAVGAANAENMSTALSWLAKSADLGNRSAAEQLANMYRDGGTVDKDPLQAVLWFRKAAALLSTEAMANLATFYQQGDGVAQDMPAAQAWRRKADSLGHFGDASMLKDYFPLMHCPENYQAIVASQIELAGSGNVDAQLAMARRYTDGDGVERDNLKAAFLWQKAALAGDPIGQRMLGKSMLRNALRDRKPGEQMHIGDALVWLQKAIAQGDTAAKVELARWYLREEENENPQQRALNREHARELAREAKAAGYILRDLASLAE